MSRSERLLRRVWKHVHPDLFARWPVAQATNQQAMQDLRAVLAEAEEQCTAIQARGTSSATLAAQDFRFFVHDGAGSNELREVSASWRPPSLVVAAALPPKAQADLWRLGAEGCLASLLSRIDPLEEVAVGAEEATRAASSESAIDRDDAVPADESVARAARAAAERRRAADGHERSSRPSPNSPPDEHAGGQLRRELLFFHGVPEDVHEQTVARLASLVRQVWPATVAHGPILVCGGEPPPPAATSGFACIGLHVSADELRRSLAAALSGASHASAASRRAHGEAMLHAGRRVRTLLGCESVHSAEPLDPFLATRMYEELLSQAAGLRAALDVAWKGVHLSLTDGRVARRAAGRRGSGSAAVAIADSTCGGCVLEICGEEGAAGALEFVQREWLALRRCQERFQLAEQLRERLGCAAVHCNGAPLETISQCDSLRKLLRVLHAQPILLPEDAELAHVVIAIGPSNGKQAIAQRAGRAERRPIEVRLPSLFEEPAALECLMRASAPADSPGGKSSSRRARRHARRRR